MKDLRNLNLFDKFKIYFMISTRYIIYLKLFIDDIAKAKALLHIRDMFIAQPKYSLIGKLNCY